MTVIPGKPCSGAIEQRDLKSAAPEQVVLKTLSVGVCGTDAEIISGRYGWAPPDRPQLIIGHEAVAIVEQGNSEWNAGQLAVPIVRCPDPIPCRSCAVEEFDMCRNGQYTEHGIKELDGFCVERFCAETSRLVPVDPGLGSLAVLLEPTSIVAKAWQHIASIGERALFSPQCVLITGAGPIGLLAALLARQRDLRTLVFDRAETGAKPQAVHALGAEYHTGDLSSLLRQAQPDIIMECTGAASIVLEVIQQNARGGIVCLVGVSAAGRQIPVDIGSLNRSIVLENDVIFGSVNANRRHYEAAAEALRQADRAWLRRLITRRVPIERWTEAFERHEEDIKVVIDFSLEGKE